MSDWQKAMDNTIMEEQRKFKEMVDSMILPPIPPTVIPKGIGKLHTKEEAELQKKLAEKRIKEYEVAKEQYTKEQYTRVGEEKVAMINNNQCPECLALYNILMMADRLRYRFRHGHIESCSRSMTEFFRPVAQFTTFI